MIALRLIIASAIILCCPFAGAAPAAGSAVAEAAGAIQDRARQSQEALALLREQIGGEQVPLARDLAAAEEELIEVRKEHDRILRIRDGRSLDVSNLKAQVKSREEQNKYLTNLLDEYARNFETRLHVAEAQRFKEQLSRARNDAVNGNLSLAETFRARLSLLELSMGRIEEAVGGAVFAGSARDQSGVMHDGKFLMLGPLCYFSTPDGSVSGLALSQLNSNEPVITPIPAGIPSAIRDAIFDGRGLLPLDASLGDAIKVAESEETLVSEIRKGGAVMYPMLALAIVAALIGIWKWLRIGSMKRVSEQLLQKVLAAIAKGKDEEALGLLSKLKGPPARMLAAGIRHRSEPRDMVEEILLERILEAKSKVHSLLPFISITAAASPLLGLLGTVTGMITTFKLITIFGTGDAQSFSAGISEALITTKWGLVIAIPALLLYGFLSRKAKSIVDHMEQISITFLTALAKENPGTDGGGPGPEPGNEPDVAPPGASRDDLLEKLNPAGPIRVTPPIPG